MQGCPESLLSVLRTLSRAIVFLSTTATGLILIAGLFILYLLFRIVRELHSSRALAAASGHKLSLPAGLAIGLESLISSGASLLAWVPVLIAVAVLSLSIVGVTEALNRIDTITRNAERIRELRAVVRNLARSERVADILVTSQQGGTTSLRIEFYDPSLSGGAVGKKELSLPGSDIYFDAIVLNFGYSEIEEGREANIAIPYRVFSEELAQKDGIPLGAVDPTGVPYAFRRSDADIYGLVPAVYRTRLAELMAVTSNDETARREGIVRSLYGNAVHRRVKPGDRLELDVEGSGGIILKEKAWF